MKMGMKRVECHLEKDGGGDYDDEEHDEDEDGNKIHGDEDGSDHEDEDREGTGTGTPISTRMITTWKPFKKEKVKGSKKISPLNFEVIVVHDLCDHVRMHNHP